MTKDQISAQYISAIVLFFRETDPSRAFNKEVKSNCSEPVGQLAGNTWRMLSV